MDRRRSDRRWRLVEPHACIRHDIECTFGHHGQQGIALFDGSNGFLVNGDATGEVRVTGTRPETMSRHHNTVAITRAR